MCQPSHQSTVTPPPFHLGWGVGARLPVHFDRGIQVWFAIRQSTAVTSQVIDSSPLADERWGGCYCEREACRVAPQRRATVGGSWQRAAASVGRKRALGGPPSWWCWCCYQRAHPHVRVACWTADGTGPGPGTQTQPTMAAKTSATRSGFGRWMCCGTGARTRSASAWEAHSSRLSA
jgi:hypothetical protein